MRHFCCCCDALILSICLRKSGRSEWVGGKAQSLGIQMLCADSYNHLFLGGSLVLTLLVCRLFLLLFNFIFVVISLHFVAGQARNIFNFGIKMLGETYNLGEEGL